MPSSGECAGRALITEGRDILAAYLSDHHVDQPSEELNHPEGGRKNCREQANDAIVPVTQIEIDAKRGAKACRRICRGRPLQMAIAPF